MINQLVSIRQEGEVAFLILGNQQVDKAIILTQERMTSLRSKLEDLKQLISKDKSIKGIVICSPYNLGFCMGADINAIKDVTDSKEGERLARQGQDIFQIIENLPLPTLCAINGPCVGGGCELALACDYRIISDDPTSKIGLPETKLGILPGFGGTQRLPRLIGLPKALDIILQGKIVDSFKAKKLGLVDDIFSYSGESDFYFSILHKSKRYFYKGKKKKYKLSFIDTLLSRTAIGRFITVSQAKKSSFKKTKGKYPAIDKSIYLASLSRVVPKIESYDMEAKLLGELIVSPESKALVHIFFLTENAQKISKKNPTEKVTTVTVVGGGIMGKGLSAVSIKSGFFTTVIEPFEKARLSVTEHITKFIESSKSLKKNKKEEKLSNLKVLSDLKDLKSSDIIIEAIIEDLDIKKKLFSDLEEGFSSETILASNTSSLKLSDVFSDLKNKERLIGIHFFNPVEKMPLVEIIRTKETSDSTLIKAVSFVSKLGKYPVIVEDVPGFLVNRILCPYLSEASRLLSLGIPLVTIDRVVTDFGFPMGPFRLIDEVGLDVGKKVESVLTEAYGERMKGSGILEKLVNSGMLGKKNGKGFYLYGGEKPVPNIELKDFGVTIMGTSPISEKEIIDRLLLSMTSEAKLCYEEGVAGKPSQEASFQIDLASIMGFGFPPFLGGILYNDTKKNN